MRTPRKGPLLAPGNEAEWARINEEKEREEVEFAASLSISERLAFGRKLCDQAFDFYNAIHVGAHDPGEIRKPDLAGVIADANAAGLPHVVVGGFAVIAHGYLRATRDSNLLVPSDSKTDQTISHLLDRVSATRIDDGNTLAAEDVAGVHHLRVSSRHGTIDIKSVGLPPLDYETVADHAVEVDVGGVPTPFASLRALVGFKRLAARGQDRLDLENLERVNGELPIEAIPGLDD